MWPRLSTLYSPLRLCAFETELRVKHRKYAPDVINCQFRKFAVAPLWPVHFLSPDRTVWNTTRWVVSGTNKSESGLSRLLQWLDTVYSSESRADSATWYSAACKVKFRSRMAFCQPVFGIASRRHLRFISRRLHGCTTLPLSISSDGRSWSRGESDGPIAPYTIKCYGFCN